MNREAPLAAAGAAALVALAYAAQSQTGGEELFEQPAWSVQLHLHGPFSEGAASIDSHSLEARDVGADVLWWSEHDYRMRSFHVLTRFSFDAPEEPLHAGEAWEPIGAFEAQRTKGLRAVSVPDEAWGIGQDGERTALELRAPARVELVAGGSSLNRPLAAEVALTLWVRAASLPAGATGALEVLLSEHAAEAPASPETGPALEAHVLRYVLGAEGDPTRSGPVLEVPVPLEGDAWTRVELGVTRDAVAGFPELVGRDNALRKLTFVLEGVLEGLDDAGAASLWFDELELTHGRAGETMYAAQAELLEAVGAHHPGLGQLQGIELSMVTPHLNAYLPSATHAELGAPDYAALVAGALEQRGGPIDRLPELGEALVPGLVEAVHGRGGLVSLNHMFGASWGLNRGRTKRKEVRAQLLASGAHGADLIEVGYRARGGHGLEDHLWVWDRLVRDGLPLVGTGVSDSHGGKDARWRTDKNNFVSWVYADAPERDALLDGLRRGRVFFGDLTRFDGRLDVVDERGLRMGRVVLTDRVFRTVVLHYEGALEGDQAVFVVDGKSEEVIELEQPSGSVSRDVFIPEDRPLGVRFELRGKDREVRALTNPIVFSTMLPMARFGPRLAFDVADVTCRDLDDVEVLSAQLTPQGERRGLALEVAATDGGELLLETLIGCTVTLEGLEGSVEPLDEGVRLRGLRGTGFIHLLRGHRDR